MFIRPLKLTQHVDVQGPENATTVILLHSLGTDMHLWDLQMPLRHRYGAQGRRMFSSMVLSILREELSVIGSRRNLSTRLKLMA